MIIHSGHCTAFLFSLLQIVTGKSAISLPKKIPGHGIRAFLLLFMLSAVPAYAQTLVSITPAAQRVNDYIELRGGGFGATQEDGKVLFSDGSTTIEGGTAYVWRPNYIKIKVPVGMRIGDTNTPIPKTPLAVSVQTAAGTSASLPFQVITASAGTFAYRQLTDINSDDVDVSTVLGSPNLNIGRTKDAEVGDVDNDGWPDIMDNNSNNDGNDTHGVLRQNNHDKTFRATPLEPLNDSDAGSFASTIPGSDYFGDAVTYDTDFADINGDNYLDIVQTATMGGGTNRLRAHINNPSDPGNFTEASNTWFPGVTFIEGHSPDDLDHVDVNRDGRVDIVVTLRDRGAPPGSITKVFLNSGGSFNPSPIDLLPSPSDVSTHDAFFIDANADGFWDVVMCNESGAGAQAQLFQHNQTLPTPGFAAVAAATSGITGTAEAGLAADLNADGFDDMVLAHDDVRAYINDPENPGQFTASTLSLDGTGTIYDVELGDLDLDGDVDVIVARITETADDTVQVWLNNGSGSFTRATDPGTSALLPNPGSYQRLSTDLLDFDRDGDLDLYFTGADGQNVGFGFGAVPNQFYENLRVGLNIVNPTQAAPAFGGSSSSGRRVFVRVRSDVDIPSVGPSSFTVTVDGTALPTGDVITASKIEQEYWLLVRVPPKADGLYDLQVALSDDPAISDTEPSSLRYDDDRAFDRVLAIDRTRSMNFDSVTGDTTGEKMEAARAAGAFFVDFSSDVDMIGVTSFKRDSDNGDGVVQQNELARDDFPLAVADPPAGADQRPAARGSAAALTPDGLNFSHETSIGAGLTQGVSMLNGAADFSHEWEIVLISDGRENYPPYWTRSGTPGPVMPGLLSHTPPIRVHTVALGRDANIEVLQDIAQKTDGLFFNLYEGSGSFFLLSRLANTYKYIDERIRDEQRFFYEEGFPVEIGQFHVAEGFESMSVGFHWNQPKAVKRVFLIDPDGIEVDDAPPAARMFSDTLHQAHRIIRPKPGLWRYRVAHKNDPGIEFFATASGIGDLGMHLGPGEVRALSPGQYETSIRVLIGDHLPITTASVTGTIMRPDKTRIPATLYDDGAHDDGRPADGIYGVRFIDSQPGAYSVDIEAEGQSSKNEAFQRFAFYSFVFPGADPDRPGQGDQPPPGKDEPCDNFNCLCWIIGIVLGVIIGILLCRWLLRRKSAVSAVG